MPDIETYPQPDVLIAARASVGEGPVIDPRTGRLCWVDITEGMLYENDLDTGRSESAHLDTMLGAAAPRRDQPGFAAAVSDGFGLVVDGKLEVTDPVLPEPFRRMNDAKCDSAGRLWAGSTHMEFEPGVGALHRWDGTGPSSLVRSGFVLPNGIGWSPDDRTMYLVDSFARTLLRADYDAADGEVGEFRVLVDIAAEDGMPDGLAVDADGFIWVAHWGGWAVRRYSPDGELAATVPMPVAQPSSCAFAQDGTLYITSATAGLSEHDLAGQPHAGSVFALPTTMAGVPVAAFAG
jgi:sugar lactone lactonase YvrE